MQKGIDITTKIGCRLNCDYCPQEVIGKSFLKIKGEKLLTLELFKNYIRTVPLDVEMCFCGFSEPWGNPDCTSLVEYAYQRGHAITIYTTLDGMTINDVQRLEKLKFLKFSIHLPDNKNEMHIQMNEEYVQVLEAVLKSSISPLTLSVQTFKFPNTKIHPALQSVLKKSKFPIRRLIDTINSRAGNLSMDQISPIQRIKGDLVFCPNMNGGLLLPNGDLYLCSMDWGLRHKIINLKTDSFQDYFQHSEYLKIIKANKDESIDVLCRTCEYAEIGCHHKAIPLILK